MNHGRFSVDYNLYQLPITNYQLPKPITKRSDGAELITSGKKIYGVKSDRGKSFCLDHKAHKTLDILCRFSIIYKIIR
jgi:hypothetical protein